MIFKKYTWLRKFYYLFSNIRHGYSFTQGIDNRIDNRGGIKVATRIQIKGNNNKVVFEKGCVCMNVLIKVLGNNNSVILGPNSYISDAELWIEDNYCLINIGERTFVGHHSHFACTEDGSKLSIGNDCMISSYVQIRTGDSHSILDMEGKRINQAKSVKIGNHVWLGEGSKVLKGVTLGDHVVVSTGAIVTKSFGNNVLIGGIPAKILKQNITWDSKRL